LDEHFRIQGKIKFYESPEKTQSDLDSYLHIHNYDYERGARSLIFGFIREICQAIANIVHAGSLSGVRNERLSFLPFQKG